MQLETLLIFLFSASILTLSPGPDIIYVFIKSSTEGKIAGIKTVFGLTTGLIFHTLLLVFGVSALINSNDYFFFILKVFGFIYFIFLAISTYNKNSKIDNKSLSSKNDFTTGLMMNVLNPKVSIFFIAFFPNYIFHNSWSYELQFSILGLIFWLIANTIFLLVVLLSSFNTGFVNNLINHNKIKVFKSVFYLFIAIWIIV
ncbi:MAG: LysE family translocator [Cryomorphaceae bacterium]|jgi:threonine/homoserine/homoserine lactone efflux protein|nr:MAG: LysE family translocator [Cryomorphaceae bacterium]|tara:strand:- start:1332 stop:1931 length:600 start_codon:yes stop_codon:yes gene_type:complete